MYLVCCCSWSCTANWSSFSFYDFHFMTFIFIKRVFPPQEDWTTRQQRPLNLVSANRGLQLLICVFPIIDTTVTVLWHPWAGLKKEVVQVSVLLVYWMTHVEVCWSGFSVSHWWECFTVLLPWVAVRKTSSGNITFSLRGQHLCFGRICLLVVCGQAQPDMEGWGWYPNTLLYFSSCKTLKGLCV